MVKGSRTDHEVVHEGTHRIRKEKQKQGDHMENLIKIQECIDDFYLSASDGSKIKQ